MNYWHFLSSPCYCIDDALVSIPVSQLYGDTTCYQTHPSQVYSSLVLIRYRVRQPSPQSSFPAGFYSTVCMPPKHPSCLQSLPISRQPPCFLSLDLPFLEISHTCSHMTCFSVFHSMFSSPVMHNTCQCFILFMAAQYSIVWMHHICLSIPQLLSCSVLRCFHLVFMNRAAVNICVQFWDMFSFLLSR